MEDIQMSSGTELTPHQPKPTGLSTKAIIAITLIVSAGLAVGLGVGLGVGLQNTVYITEPIKDKSTTTPPIVVETTSAVSVATTLASISASTLASTSASTSTSTSVSTSTSSIPASGPWTNYRLSEYMVPSHYEITLRPNITTNDYTGTNAITFQTSQETEYVIIHAHSTLMIPNESVKLQRASSMEDVAIVQKFRWEEYDFYVVKAATELNTGEDYVLTLDFSNSLTDSIVGIYKSTYVDPNTGETKGIVASDFEPTDARKGYPCFDEPAMKAQYTITIVHEEIHTALSNMPVETEVDLGNGIKQTTFAKSVKMSTYLSCFVVGELSFVETKSSRGIPLRIYGAPYQIDGGQAELALNSTAAMFDNYEALFNMTYALPKYDQVAVPEFLAGAMENWGLVIYRETNLMWDPQESSTYNKQRVNAVIAHEMVHQWFGNTVTMEWWNNIWLNEGFASYFEYRGLAWANPDWLTDGHFLIDDLQYSMRADQSIGSHPIVVNVDTPAEITTVFDTISYQKGSSVLNMMKYILGENLFIGGLRNYLEINKFGVATEQDLWDAIQEYVDSQSASYDIKTLMDPWVQQMGYPVVTVTTTGDEAEAIQEPGFTDRTVDIDSLAPSLYGYEWNIKLNYFTAANPSTINEDWLNRGDTSKKFDVSGSGDWLKFNEREQVYYRVNYDTAMWGTLVNQLTDDLSAITEMDRCHLLDDAFNLAPATRINYTQALDLTTYLDKEESYFVWKAFSSGSSYIRAMLLNTEYYTNFKAYYVTRVKHIADKLGWDATVGTHEDKRNRPTVLDLAARYGDDDALNNATKFFQEWKSDKYVHPDLRSVVYRYGIQRGTAGDWNTMLEKYKTSTVAGERDNLLRGLSSTEDVELIDTLLELTRDPTVIKEQDFFNCLTYISGYTVIGNTMTWSWVRVNWDYMVTRFGLDSRSLGRLVPSVVQYYNTELQKWEVESFFNANPDAGAGESGRLSVLLQIDLNIAWMAENAAPIGLWLADKVAKL